MALKDDKLEDNLNCPICAAIFKEPVILPCQDKHKVCRPCLKSHVKHSKSKNQNGDAVTSASECQVITCPVCGSCVDLGVKGVEYLPVQVTFASMVEKHCRQSKLGEEVRKCSVCEDGFKKPAVKFCLTCSRFYCHDCATLLHPMIGKLKGHILITVEDYLCRQKVTGTSGITDHAVDAFDLCDFHSLKVLALCGLCQRPLCKSCIAVHDGHPLKDVSVLYRQTEKQKIDAMNDLKNDTEKLFVELNKFLVDNEKKKSLQIAEIEKAYKKTIESATHWRLDCLKTIEERHEEWRLACMRAKKKLQLKIEEIRTFLRLLNEQLYKSRLRAIKDHGELMTRITGLYISTKEELQHLRDMSTKCRNHMDCYVVLPRKLYLREDRISTPRMRFTEKLSDCVLITDNDTFLVSVKQEDKVFTGALTDGILQTGSHYWELHIRFNVKKTQNKNDLVYSAGVVRKGSDIWWYVGCGKLSWGVSVSYIHSQYQYIFSNNGKVLSTPVPVYPHNVTERGLVRQGFYLNCLDRTLVITDRTNSRVLHTFTDLDLSEPLTPAVSVDNYHWVDVSVRLIPFHHQT